MHYYVDDYSYKHVVIVTCSIAHLYRTIIMYNENSITNIREIWLLASHIIFIIFCKEMVMVMV